MKILLINPSQEKVYGKRMSPAYPPLGLMYTGTVLRNEGHRVRLLDIDPENINEEKFERVMADFAPNAVGITSTTPTVKDALKWAGLCKRLNKNAPVIFGGAHATIVPGDVIKESAVDIVVIGESESTSKELFNELSGPGPELERIKGIYFKRAGKVTMNDRRPFIEDLDSIPFPDRTLLEKPDAFVPPDAVYLPVATIITSRGCPGNCTFCCTKQIFSKRFRARSVKNMIEEIEQLTGKERIREIHILDDVFTLDKKRTLKFCEEIKRRNIRAHFQLINGLRADFVNREILGALKSIGVKTLGYGVETGNEKILKSIKKNIPFDVTRKAFKLSKELGFETWAFLIFGLPGETEETIKDTIRFTKELNPDLAKFLVLKPYPGSEVYEELRKKNLILNNNYEDYGVYTKPVHRLPFLEPERMLYWQKRAFREFYLRPGKIFFHLKRIRSWTQLKILINDFLFVIYLMFRSAKNKKSP